MNKPIVQPEETTEHTLFGHVIHMAQHNVTRDEFMQLRQEMKQGFEKSDHETGRLRAEMYQGNPKQFGKQLQYADRRGSPIAIIQGSDERERGIVQVKDLIEGRRLSAEITDNEEWRASRPAQFECPVEELVPTVLATLKAQRES